MKKSVTRIRHICHDIKFDIMGRIYSLNPKRHAEHRFKQAFGRRIDWEQPTGFIEKLRWIQFRTDSRMRTLLADKLAAREFVAQKGFRDILIPQYGAWASFHDIPFHELPDSFVLKTSHGSGDAMIITNKNTIDKKRLQKHFKRALSHAYGRYDSETHYNAIPRRILAEKLLHNDTAFSSSIVDYKFYCFNGNPALCLVCYNRTDIGAHASDCDVYDMHWECHNEWLRPDVKPGNGNIPRPTTFARMTEICKTLGQGIPFVRIDLLEENAHTYFGEFTFSPNGYKPLPFTEECFGLLSEHLLLPQPDLPIT